LGRRTRLILGAAEGGTAEAHLDPIHHGTDALARLLDGVLVGAAILGQLRNGSRKGMMA
jgi:hypothetical protein